MATQRNAAFPVVILFLDGLGLGEDHSTNPLAQVPMPFLQHVLRGRRLVRREAGYHGPEATLLALDPGLDVPGTPQSATGQATLLRGEPVMRLLGYHYGPKPNPDVAAFLQTGTLFHRLQEGNHGVDYVNAFPPRYFRSLASGRRLPGAIAMAARFAGLPLHTREDLLAGRALAADFTQRIWRTHLNDPEVPEISPEEAGKRLARLARERGVVFLEHWFTDWAGHRRDAAWAEALLRDLDRLLAGLLSHLPQESLVLVVSDHGNLEDLGTRHHTRNPVPLLLLGPEHLRRGFTGVTALHEVTPTLLAVLGRK